MKSWFGTYYESPNAGPVEATVLASEKKISIGFRSNEAATTLHWNTRDTEAIFDLSLQATRIVNKNERGSKLVVEGKDPYDFLMALNAEQNKAWHKKDKTKEWGRNFIILTGVLGILVLVYFLIVPWLSEKMASRVSVSTEEQFGNSVYNALGLSSQEDPEATMMINDFFSEMKVRSAYPIRITVVRDEMVNAFALPGGHIVVYSALLKQVETYPELAALLSHEFTHVNNKHSTKSIFRQLGSRIFLNLLFGNFGTVSSIMVDQADKLKSLTYSRKLEKEADMEGLALLKERKIDPAGFVSLFRHLQAAGPASSTPEFLGSHPDIANRIAYMQEASGAAVIEENSTLKAIFDKLKSTEP
jgi:Zn-dependent protease with chaperone function